MYQQPKKEKEVWIACDKIFEQGKQLTYKNIGDELEFLGFKRGSNSDIKKYLDTWRQNKPKHNVEQDELSVSIKNLRESLKYEANKYIEQIQEELENEVLDLHEKLNQKESELLLEQKQLVVYKEELAGYKEKHEQVISESVLNKTKAKELADKVKEYKTSIDSHIEQHIKEYKTLEEKYFEQLSSLHQSHDKNILELQNLHQKQVDRLMLENDKLKTEQSSLSSRYQKEVDKNKLLEKDFQGCLSRIQSLESKLHEQEKKVQYYITKYNSYCMMSTEKQRLERQLKELKSLFKKAFVEG